MTASTRLMNAKAQAYHANVHKRGAVADTMAAKKKDKLPVGPVVLGFFLFVVVGSALLQIIRTATTPPNL